MRLLFIKADYRTTFPFFESKKTVQNALNSPECQRDTQGLNLAIISHLPYRISFLQVKHHGYIVERQTRGGTANRLEIQGFVHAIVKANRYIDRCDLAT